MKRLTSTQHLDVALKKVAQEGVDFRMALLTAMHAYAVQEVEALRAAILKRLDGKESK